MVWLPISGPTDSQWPNVDRSKGKDWKCLIGTQPVEVRSNRASGSKRLPAAHEKPTRIPESALRGGKTSMDLRSHSIPGQRPEYTRDQVRRIRISVRQGRFIRRGSGDCL